jgi:signal transduction histidine kinase
MDPHATGRIRWAGWAPDALAAVLAVGVLVAVSAHIRGGPSGRPLDALGYVLLVSAGVAMGLCRRWPQVAVGMVTVVLGIFVARRYPDGPVWVTAWIALGALSWRTSRRVAVAGAAVMLAVLSVSAVVVGRVGILLPLVFAGWMTAAVLGADALRNRRSYLAGLRERALFLERTREEETRRRVAEERLRIARDLHDSVAHAMATINVQAGAAAHVLSRRPQAAGEALAAIQRASSDVLDELGAMLAVLRDETQQADRAPVPGVGEIRRLTQTMAASGLAVELSVDGPVDTVSGVIGTAAYRVVQESLTNVLRHSQASTARVRLVSGPGGRLVLEIGDDGPGEPQAVPGTGVGIRGMRERVVSTGGTFQAGPAEDGGFLVRAEWDSRS